MRRWLPALAGGLSLLAYAPPAAWTAPPPVLPDSPQALAAAAISSSEFAVYARRQGKLHLSVVSVRGERQVGPVLRAGLRVDQVATSGRNVVAGAVDETGRVVIAAGRVGERLRIRRFIGTSEPAKRVTIAAVKVDPSGSAIVVYTLFRGGRRVLASLSRRGGPFTGPIAITERRERLAAVSADVNGSGDAIVAYVEGIIHGRHDVAARTISEGRVRPTQRFANGEVGLGSTTLATAIDRNGSAHVVWHAQGGSDLRSPAGVVGTIGLGKHGKLAQPVRLDAFSLSGVALPGGSPDYDPVYQVDGARVLIAKRARAFVAIWGAFDGTHYVVRASPLARSPEVRTISPRNADAQLATTSDPGVVAWTLGLRGSLAPAGASFALGLARATNGVAAFGAPVTATTSAARPTEVIAARAPDGSSVLLAWSSDAEPRLHTLVVRTVT